MPDTRVFISYAPDGQKIMQRLTKDLSEGGIEVKADEPDFSLEHVNYQLLPHAQWLLLVRSPQAEHSARVRDEVEAAMGYTVNQRMRGVLAISSASPTPNAPPAWSVIRSFPATDPVSYERSLPSLLDVVRAGPARPVTQPDRALEAGHTHPARRNPRPRILATIAAALLIVLLAAIVIYVVPRMRPNNYLVGTTVTAVSGTHTPRPAPTATSSPTPAATPTAITDPQSFYNNMLLQKPPTLSDPMNGTGTNQWDKNGTSCVFAPHYHITASPGRYNPCMLQGPDYTNFAYQVSMTIGNSYAGGLIFRAKRTPNQPMTTFYRFSLQSSGNIALVACTTCAGNYVTGEGTVIPLEGVNPIAYQDKNTIAVIVSGNMFYFFVNQTFIAQATDNSIQTGGGIGLYAASISDASPAATGAFSDVKVWAL